MLLTKPQAGMARLPAQLHGTTLLQRDEIQLLEQPEVVEQEFYVAVAGFQFYQVGDFQDGTVAIGPVQGQGRLRVVRPALAFPDQSLPPIAIILLQAA